MSLGRVNKKFIVISSRGKVLHIGRPLETTDLLSVTGILLSIVTITIAASEIIEQNRVVSRASYEVVASQTDSPYSLYVSIEGPNKGLLLYVSYLSVSIHGSNGHSLREQVKSQRRRNVKVFIDVQFLNLAGLEGPKVNTISQRDSQIVISGPVKDIHIKVVLEIGSIQDFEGSRMDSPFPLPGQACENRLADLVLGQSLPLAEISPKNPGIVIIQDIFIIALKLSLETIKILLTVPIHNLSPAADKPVQLGPIVLVLGVQIAYRER